jgi:hypothetical protein
MNLVERTAVAYTKTVWWASALRALLPVVVAIIGIAIIMMQKSGVLCLIPDGTTACHNDPKVISEYSHIHFLDFVVGGIFGPAVKGGADAAYDRWIRPWVETLS